MRRPSGFTIVEIIVVLLLMSILAATLLGRSITTSKIDLNSATDKIRNQLRFAQAEAMKRAYGPTRMGCQSLQALNTGCSGA